MAFSAAGVAAGAQSGQATADPDLLYANRGNLEDARHAAAIWQAGLDRNPNDFEAAWKRARAAYWIGKHLEDEDAQKAELGAGMAAARAAIRVHPDRPEGHFWLAATMGVLAERGGIRAGLRYRSPIRKSLERVLEIDPSFQLGSADRALGRWYYLVPRLFGGSRRKSEEHLRRSLEYDPDSIASRFFLAETLEADDREEEAAAELRRILATPPNPEWLPEDREFKQKARAMLDELTDD
ncbi:MAG TPA: TRAP transporter TatT component family protein [Methylomirabilota bacterium]